MPSERAHDSTAPVLLTGASGALGRQLAAALAAAGWTLRLTDIAPFPDRLPPRARFDRCDLAHLDAIATLAAGCRLILHFGGASTDRPFEEVLEANLRGVWHVFEAARQAGARVLFASSNHAVGFHERAERLDADCAFRPDSYYGLSKAYGELMGRLYWDKHGVESVSVRIGSSYPEPADARMLSTWLAYDDLVSLCLRCGEAKEVGCATIWGASANARSFWGEDDRARLGWAPARSADPWAERVGRKVSGDPVQERFQGGAYAAAGYSRESA